MKNKTLKSIYIIFLLLSFKSIAGVNDLDYKFTGNNFIESNSPEVIYGPGYVFKHDENNGSRGQKDFPLNGCTNIYFFHINKSKSNLQFHLLVKSKDPVENKLVLEGSSYTNSERPLGPFRGQSYQVASDWLKGNLKYQKVAALDTNYKSLIVKRFNKRNMIDGKFRVCADRAYYVALVVSNTRSEESTVKQFLSESAPGIILPVRNNTYGRVAAIFEKSKIKGEINVNSSFQQQVESWHINTISKFAKDRHLQNQTMKCVYNFDDSSCRSNGNYGREYEIDLNIKNNSNDCIRYNVSFGSNYTNDKDTPSFTWNCPIQVDNMLVPTYTTPTKPDQLLTTVDIKENGTRQIKLKFIPCGLITAKQNLKVEELSCDAPKSKPLTQVQKYKKAIRQLIQGNYNQEIHSKSGQCLDYSILLLRKLNNMGFNNLQLAETTPKRLIRLNKMDGSSENADRIHFFLVDRSLDNGDEIIIDPTYLQFFENKIKEPVFVGTQKDLISLYQKNIKNIGWQSIDGQPINAGMYKPEQLSCLIYSSGSCFENRIIH